MDVELVATLYNWYSIHVGCVEEQVVASGVRNVLGYVDGDKKREPLPQSDFLGRLQSSWQSSTTKQNWINRFVRGHDLDAEISDPEVRQYLMDCTLPLPAALRTHAVDGPHYANSVRKSARTENPPQS